MSRYMILVHDIPQLSSLNGFKSIDKFSLFNSLPKDKFQEWSKLKKFADNNFEFDENGRKFSKRVENTVGQGEIAYYKQFLLFPQYFLKT